MTWRHVTRLSLRQLVPVRLLAIYQLQDPTLHVQSWLTVAAIHLFCPNLVTLHPTEYDILLTVCQFVCLFFCLFACNTCVAVICSWVFI